jgi:four helix bundle protein
VVEEADESILWLELLEDAGVMAHERLDSLQSEARELTALFTASHNTSRRSK